MNTYDSYKQQQEAMRISEQNHLNTMREIGQRGVNAALDRAISSLPKTPVNSDPNKK